MATKRMARRASKAPPPKVTYVDVMFRDTVTGSMLRTLLLRRSMPQAEFMTLYHARCNRDNPGKSSFVNNFGHLVSRTRSYYRPGEWQISKSPIACIAQDRIVGATVSHGIVWRDTKRKATPNTLAWEHSIMVADLLASRTDAFVTEVEQTLERIATGQRLARNGKYSKPFADVGTSDDAGALLLDVQRYMRVRVRTGKKAA